MEETRINFLDLDGCSDEDQNLLESILFKSKPSKIQASASSNHIDGNAPAIESSHIGSGAVAISSANNLYNGVPATSMSISVPNHHGFQPHSQIPATFPHSIPPSVFINNVTANVNFTRDMPPPPEGGGMFPPGTAVGNVKSLEPIVTVHHHHQPFPPQHAPPQHPNQSQVINQTAHPHQFPPHGFPPFPPNPSNQNIAAAAAVAASSAVYPFHNPHLAHHMYHHPMINFMQPPPQSIAPPHANNYHQNPNIHPIPPPMMMMPPFSQAMPSTQNGIVGAQQAQHHVPPQIPVTREREQQVNVTEQQEPPKEIVKEKAVETTKIDIEFLDFTDVDDEIEFQFQTDQLSDTKGKENSAAVERKKSAQDVQTESKPKSWASLFHREISQPSLDYESNANKPTAKITPFNPNDSESSNIVPVNGTEPHIAVPEESGLVKYLKEHVLSHRSPPFRPRGLSNRSNWCFVNAILQALVSCPPFLNFIHNLPLDEVASRPPMPITTSIWRYVQEIDIMTNFPKLNRRDKSKKGNEDIPLGKTVEASTILNMLLNLKGDTFKVIEGRQEDAEEFLTFLLNGINDEIQALLKSASGQNLAPQNSGLNEEEFDPDEWKEVGPKNKSCTTRRQALSQTPLGDMFQGQIRSCVQHSEGEPTATLQPFFTLQLDIQSDSVHTISDALLSNFTTEALDGYINSATKEEVEASRSLSLEDLPPILILHMKRFVYDSSGGSQKLLKKVDFSVDLEIPKDILSPNSRGKFGTKQRQYKLFAVVYHNGSEAVKGHYVADIYHTSLATWLRCDDSIVKSINESSVLAHHASSVPYILFYRRGDTMMGLDKSKASQ